MKIFLKNLRRNSHAGVSLIIAITFVAAFMLIMAGLFEARLRVIQAIGNRELEAKARYLAESALELGSAWAAERVGTNTADANEADASGDLSLNNYNVALLDVAEAMGISRAICEDINSATDGNQPCAKFEVVGRAVNEPGNDNRVQYTPAGGGAAVDLYSVPLRGSGDAGEECSDDPSGPADANSSCNWNRLYFGQSVEIPLYYEGAAGHVELNPSVAGQDGQTGTFRLRVRAPCDGFEHGETECPAAERVLLYPPIGNTNFRNVEHDPVLIQWVISGEGNESLVASDVANDGVRPLLNFADRAGQNTELSAGRINAARAVEVGNVLDDFRVIEQNYKGEKIGIVNSVPPEIGDFIFDQSKPILRLSMVSRPKMAPVATSSGDATLFTAQINSSELDVPYLEYQLLTSDPVSDSKSIIAADIEVGGFKKEIFFEKKRPQTLGGFAFEQF